MNIAWPCHDRRRSGDPVVRATVETTTPDWGAIAALDAALVARGIASVAVRGCPMAKRERPNLSPAHWRVLERLAMGESDAQIAAALGIPLRTVTDRVGVLYARLPLGEGANHRVAAAVWYVCTGRKYHRQLRDDE
jgi:DNA-binding NarL/FixJ family response regulator